MEGKEEPTIFLPNSKGKGTAVKPILIPTSTSFSFSTSTSTSFPISTSTNHLSTLSTSKLFERIGSGERTTPHPIDPIEEDDDNQEENDDNQEEDEDQGPKGQWNMTRGHEPHTGSSLPFPISPRGDFISNSGGNKKAVDDFFGGETNFKVSLKEMCMYWRKYRKTRKVSRRKKGVGQSRKFQPNLQNFSAFMDTQTQIKNAENREGNNKNSSEALPASQLPHLHLRHGEALGAALEAAALEAAALEAAALGAAALGAIAAAVEPAQLALGQEGQQHRAEGEAHKGAHEARPGAHEALPETQAQGPFEAHEGAHEARPSAQEALPEAQAQGAMHDAEGKGKNEINPTFSVSAKMNSKFSISAAKDEFPIHGQNDFVSSDQNQFPSVFGHVPENVRPCQPQLPHFPVFCFHSPAESARVARVAQTGSQPGAQGAVRNKSQNEAYDEQEAQAQSGLPEQAQAKSQAQAQFQAQAQGESQAQSQGQAQSQSVQAQAESVQRKQGQAQAQSFQPKEGQAESVTPKQAQAESVQPEQAQSFQAQAESATPKQASAQSQSFQPKQTMKTNYPPTKIIFNCSDSCPMSPVPCPSSPARRLTGTAALTLHLPFPFTGRGETPTAFIAEGGTQFPDFSHSVLRVRGVSAPGSSTPSTPGSGDSDIQSPHFPAANEIAVSSTTTDQVPSSPFPISTPPARSNFDSAQDLIIFDEPMKFLECRPVMVSSGYISNLEDFF